MLGGVKALNHILRLQTVDRLADENSVIVTTARDGSASFRKFVLRQLVQVVENKITANLLYQTSAWRLIALQQEHRFIGELEEDLAEPELRKPCVHVLLADSDTIELEMARDVKHCRLRLRVELVLV